MKNRFIRTFYAVFQIARVLFAYVWYRQVTYYLKGRGRRRAEFEKVHERCAKLLFRTFSRLRGAYIKLAQFLSTQAILPPVYLIEFAKMQDQVEPMPFEKIEKALAHEWGPDWRRKFRDIDPKPLAAASIAQVHKATLADGREVVLKVQYPGIEEFFNKDLQLVGTMLPYYIKAIEFTYTELRTTVDHQAMIRELFGYIARELDYENEVHYQKKMQEFFATWKSVVVPKIVDELCTKKIICMEYIEGTRVIEWFENASQEDRDLVFETIMDAAFYTMVVKGCFQADSHPGNFLVTPDKKFVLLDFGCVKELKPEFRQGTIKLVQAYINRDPRAAAEVLFKLGFRTKLGTVESLQKWVEYGFEITDTVLEHFKHGHDLVGHLKENLASLATRFAEINTVHTIAHIPEEYVLVSRALATPPVPFDKYKPQVDVLSLALEHLASVEV